MSEGIQRTEKDTPGYEPRDPGGQESDKGAAGEAVDDGANKGCENSTKSAALPAKLAFRHY